ncbi:MAG: aspartyl protease family protein [Candidatus Zixiibacteriota bacterium]|nr:MAG: aspartyl protease family protein [candidate division Zixibacteria bacterium]
MRTFRRNMLPAMFIAGLSCVSAPAAVSIRDFIPAERITAMEKVVSMRSTGTISVGGLTGDVEMVYAVPAMTYLTADLGILQFAQGFDGFFAWARDQNNQVAELTGLDLRKVVNDAFVASQSYVMDDRMPGVVEYVKDSSIGSSAYHIFFALPEGGDSLWLFISYETGRVEITREYLDELLIYTYYHDFREVEGIDVAFRVTAESSNPLLNSIITINSVEINIPVDRSLFAMATEIAIDYAFPRNVDSVVMTMNYINGFLLLEAEVIGGDSAVFILDSGAGMNVIDQSFARRIGLEVTGELPAKGVSGYEAAGITHIDSLDIGGVRLLHQKAAVFDFSNLNLRLPGKPGGILGYDFLSRFPFRIDYRRRKFTIYHPEAFRPPDSNFAISFDLYMKIPVIAAEIEGCRGEFMVDLGNALGLILHRRFTEHCNIREKLTDIKDMEHSVGGIGGTSQAYAATGHDLRFGAVEVKKVPLAVAGGDEGAFGSAELDGNIGNLLLEKFSVVLDYTSKTIYVLPEG